MRKYTTILSAVTLTAACSPAGNHSNSQRIFGGTPGHRILEAAQRHIGKEFRPGTVGEAMPFVRTILSEVCGPQFDTAHTTRPWDTGLLGPNEPHGPNFADSLASEEFGMRIASADELAPGDLVFLKNTFGNWPDGVITHVGIAAEQPGQFISRFEREDVVALTEIDRKLFVGGLRLSKVLCP